MNERYKYIDLGAALLILWVLCLHALSAGLSLQEIKWANMGEGSIDKFTNIKQIFPFLMFSMPWFFYKAGMFFRLRPIKELFIYDCRKLLKPFLIWSFIGYIFYVIICIVDGSASFHSLTYSVIRGAFLTERFPINYALWFLMSLFIVRQICNIVIPKFPPPIIALIGILIAYICHILNMELIPDWIPNIGIGLFFFSLGYWLRNKKILEKTWNIISWMCMVVFISWCFISYLLPLNNSFRIPIVSMVDNTLVQGIYLLWYPISIIGILGFNKLMMKCESISLPFLSWVSKNIMLIYVIHYIPCHLLQWLTIKYFSSLNVVTLIGMIFLSYCVIFGLIKLINNKVTNYKRII